MGQIRFDDPDDLGEYSRILVHLMMSLDSLDYARRYFERKGDISSMKRAKEIRKLFKETVLDCAYFHRAIIPEDVVHRRTELRFDSMRKKQKH